MAKEKQDNQEQEQENEDESNVIAEVLAGTLMTSNEIGRDALPANIVDGVFEIARALQRLGDTNANTIIPLSGANALGKAMLASSEKIAAALNNLADAIRERKE